MYQLRVEYLQSPSIKYLLYFTYYMSIYYNIEIDINLLVVIIYYTNNNKKKSKITYRRYTIYFKC